MPLTDPWKTGTTRHGRRSAGDGGGGVASPPTFQRRDASPPRHRSTRVHGCMMDHRQWPKCANARLVAPPCERNEEFWKNHKNYDYEPHSPSSRPSAIRISAWERSGGRSHYVAKPCSWSSWERQSPCQSSMSWYECCVQYSTTSLAVSKNDFWV